MDKKTFFAIIISLFLGVATSKILNNYGFYYEGVSKPNSSYKKLPQNVKFSL